MITEPHHLLSQEHLLLRDFEHWFTQLPLRLPGVSRDSLQPLRDRVRSSLDGVAALSCLELDAARAMTIEHRDPEEFLVTLDGGIYFSQFDFSFAMTRAVTRPSDVVGGRTIRVAREGFGAFWAQVAMLRRAVDAKGANTIVVSDDGISTGLSLAEVIRQLAGQYLEVSRIEVLVNPHHMEAVQDVPVQTLYSGNISEWNHERDFFWGSPTGGISLLAPDNMNSLGGIPYSFSSALLSQKVGAPAEALSQIRRELLEVNVDFWSILQHAAGRTLRLRDCKRLSWLVSFSEELTERTPMENVIGWFIDNDPPPEGAVT